MPRNEKLSPADERYRRQVQLALDAALARARAEARELASSERYIIFSDQHRGIRNRADDFLRSERAYNAALAWYFRLGYTLVVLGDVEELWKENPAPVLEAYDYCLSLEVKFHQAGRYLRVWGNHDDEWQYEDAVKRHLQPLYGALSLKVHEGLLFTVREGDQELGRLFLVHGHQGTTLNDLWSRYSRLAVRYLWRPLQRAVGPSLNTPATDWQLRERHNLAMHAWATRQEKLLLIAGHTHRPVFESRSHAAQITAQLEVVEAKLADAPDDEELQRQAADLAAELEWVRAQGNQKPGPEGSEYLTKPCYFNTGCCCFTDGNITGIEIDRGEIRLVRWPDDQRQPRPQVLERDLLKEVFEKC
jgi:predicted phosphodiesterase